MDSPNLNSQKAQILKLNLEDSKNFVDSLLNPPQANEALKKAALRYSQLISKTTDMNL